MVEPLSRILSRTVPVSSFSQEREPPAPPVAVPQAGRRWGKASGFSFSASQALRGRGSSLSAEFPADETVYMRIIDAPAHIASVIVNKKEGDSFIHVRRIQSIDFAYSEPQARQSESGFTYRRYVSWRLRLDQHPDDEEEGEVPT